MSEANETASERSEASFVSKQRIVEKISGAEKEPYPTTNDDFIAEKTPIRKTSHFKAI